jgi:PAS domain S-box-containing protein
VNASETSSQEIEELRRRLEEAEDALRALHAGEVDAIVVATEREQVYTLEAADSTYRLLVDQMPQAAATLTVNGEILSCNRLFAEMLGHPLAALRNKPFREYVAPESRPDIEPLLRESLAVEVHVELLMQRADGRGRPVFLRIAGLKEGARGQCLMVTDQTAQRHYRELREAQQSMRALRERLELAQEAGQLGIFEWNLEGGDAVLWSPIHEAHFGLQKGAFGGRFSDWQSVVHPKDTTSFAKAFRGAVAERAPLVTEYRIIRPDGAIRWIDSRAKVDCDPEGTPVRMVGVSRDVTARKSAVLELERSNAEKDEFLATLAHELRNPLAPIRSAVEVIRLSGPEGKELEWARQVIERQVRIMARLLEDLLDVSRLSRRRLELRRQRLELSAVVDAALETSRPLIEARQHALTIDLPSEPVWLDGDPVRLAQVFSNLLNNAATYTENGGVIRLAAEVRGNEAVVSVRDNGIGIPADAMPFIFEVFTQAAPASLQSRGGLGIGLSLVKGLVELHGGRVDVQSNGPEPGTAVVVFLPLAIAGAADAAQSAEAERSAACPATQVLVVDDNRDSADTLAKLLELAGHTVRTAYDGAQALHVAAELRPEIVLLDLGMPGIDGYEVCRRIRGEPWGREMFLIALTGWGQESDRRRTAEAGFDVHLVKPVQPDTVLKLMIARSPAQ